VLGVLCGGVVCGSEQPVINVAANAAAIKLFFITYS